MTLLADSALLRFSFFSPFLLPLVLSLGLVACGQGSSDQPGFPTVSAQESGAIEQYYADHPEFFSFKSIEDLPEELHWEDGQDQPEIGSPEAQKGGTYYSAMADFPRTLRWFGPDANSHFRHYLLDDTLLLLGRVHPQTLQIYPGLAQEWAIDRANKTVYIRLHPEAQWSDGNPVTSADFLYSFYFYQSPHIQSPWMNNFYASLFSHVTRYDDTTFSVTATAAKPDFAEWIINMTPIPSHFLGELKEDFVEKFQWTFWPTTGPYKIAEGGLEKGRSITLTRIKDWWARDRKFFRYRFNPDRIHVKVIRDEDKTLETFRRGEIDQIAINESVEWYDKFPTTDPLVANGYVHKVQFHNQHPYSVGGLYLNSQRPPLDNLDVRLGIQFASNWQLVIDRLFRGDYRRINSWADGYGDFDHPDIKARPFDIDRARQHFAAAGFDRAGPDGILQRSTGERLSFTVSFSGDEGEHLLTMLRQEALKAGLDLRLEQLDRTASWKKVQEKKHEIQYTGFSNFLEMYPRFWEGAHSITAFDKAFLEDGSINPDREIKPQTNNFEVIALYELDKLIDAYDTSEDRDEMVALSHRMIEILHEHAAFSPGAMRDFYRVAHWRWVRYPEDFNVKYSNNAEQYWVHWVDPVLKAETLEARDAGRGLPPRVEIFDQYREH